MKKLQLLKSILLLLALIVGGANFASAAVFERITSTGALEAGKRYIIVYETRNVAMGVISSSKGTEVSVTISDHTITLDNSTTVNILTLGGTTNEYTLLGNQDSKYIGGANSTDLSSNTSVVNNSYKWKITFSSNNAVINNVTNSTRYIKHNGSSDWRHYTSSNGNAIQLYKEITSAPSISADNVELDYDETSGEITYSIANPVAGAAVSATSSNDWISTIVVNESTKKVSFNTTENDSPANRVGTITINYKKDEETLASKNVTITQGHYDLQDPVFTPVAGFYKTAQSVTISCATESSSIYYTVDGTDPTISSTLYSSAIPVSEHATIKAVSYKEGHYSNVITANYYIDESLADFTWNLGTNSYNTGQTENLIQWSHAAATMKNEKGAGTSVINYIPTAQTSTRFYANNILTITPSSNNVIKSIIFTATTNNYASALKNSTWTNATATVNEATVTVSPINGGNNISAVIGGTCGFTAVKVIYSTNEYVTVGSSNYASYCSSRNLDFSSTDVKAYKAKVDENKVVLTKVDEVPAGEGVVLYCATAGTYNIPVIASASAVSENELVGVTSRTLVEWETGGDGKYNYILQQGAFKKATTGGYLKANRAYLHTTYDVTSPGAHELEMVFDGDVTGIKNLSPALSQGEGVAYNLAGQRVNASHKGIVIVNGKKYLNK